MNDCTDTTRLPQDETPGANALQGDPAGEIQSDLLTTATFESIVRGMFIPDTGPTAEDDGEWDPSWYSTD